MLAIKIDFPVPCIQGQFIAERLTRSTTRPMKRLICLATFVLLTSCNRPPLRTIPPDPCNLSQNFAKTAQIALSQLVGRWQIQGITERGGSNSIPIPNLAVEFKADGYCLITQDGQPLAPLAYSVADGAWAPILRVNDSTQTTSRTLLGRSTLFICETNLVLFYGQGANSNGYGYLGQRVSP